MAQLNQVFKCNVCGNIIEVVHAGQGEIVCCGKPMTLQVENTVDAAREKHIPVIEKLDGEILVKVGSVEHPMEEKHYIEWIELICENKVYRKHLKPGEKPEARFKVCDTSLEYTAREYCNIHGHWVAQN
ncbi:desulfoferrodoxin [Clostridium cellulovorans]|uniref:Desulfoferrodoxin n=1 Tax=Clostridium cellulovorans (strain ATCC 35296 / DSM 3052 / OCM 3 / 743B) TaxID=573061 RepID=D9SMF9_CLOC7|nr:desulfoferrodoxin [Clostridium cellulovorans]ADL53815.1 desulfoferrodoxin [Clostridium cellulovorans 743B]